MSTVTPVARYKRDAQGRVVHRADCPVGPRTFEWEYARAMTPLQIQTTIEQHPWLRACARCRPDVEA